MRVLITGGAGFIGTSAAARFIRQGHTVCVLDNLQRPGARLNLEWLRVQADIVHEPVDIRDAPALRRALESFAPDLVLHLAAQVAVTTSVRQPREDFEINVAGTFNLLEAIRESGGRTPLLFASTNKVYGQMEDLSVVVREGRYAYADLPYGVAESVPLDFHSPYGCSKGAADQYVRDYWRIYGIPTVTFRQSCIYGERQFGVEDQGWVAWLTIAALLDRPITVYGDGRQVRDVLYIDDLLSAFELAYARLDQTRGEIYNIGGGPAFTLSLLELVDLLSQRLGRPVRFGFADWRPGDQRVYISDVRKAARGFGWTPTTSVRDGIDRLFNWAQRHADLLRSLFP